MTREQTTATQTAETTEQKPELTETERLALERKADNEERMQRWMKKGIETPAEVADEMQAEATEKTAKVVADSEKLAGEAREVGADEIAEQAAQISQETTSAKEKLGQEIATETTQEAQLTPEQAQDDVFKSIAKQRNEAQKELGEKQQKSTRQILEEMKGQTIADLRRALNIRNDYLVDQIKVYQELIDSEKPNQGLQRKDERIRLRELESEQEENAAKSRELLRRQSYEIYE